MTMTTNNSDGDGDDQKVRIRKRKGAVTVNDADTIYNGLEEIRAKTGYLTPNNIVQESTPEDSDLHDEFEWDNTVAGHEHRKSQARGLVRSIEIIQPDKPTTRVYESSIIIKEVENQDKPQAERVYLTRDEVLSDPLRRDQLIATAIREAVAFRKKYNDLQELAQIFAAMDETITHLQA